MPLRGTLSVVGALLLASAASAQEAKQEPKAPNLAELREAVATANKRGENVDEIRTALGVLEKALAKGTTKWPDTPPELTALRDAVELAARKGEQVEAISKELGLIEQALVGRAYERPKTREPDRNPPQVAPLPPRRGFGGGGRGIVIGNAGLNSTSITISNGNFTIKGKQGDVTYELTGTINGTDAPKIVIRDGEKKIETDDLKKVPEEYRPTAERLLNSINRR